MTIEHDLLITMAMTGARSLDDIDQLGRTWTAEAVRAHDAPGLWAMMRRAMDLAREDDIVAGFASLALPYYVRDHDTGDEDRS